MLRSYERVKFCFRNDISVTKHLICCKQFLKTSVYQQYLIGIKIFKVGSESVEDNPQSGRPSTSINDQEIQKVR